MSKPARYHRILDLVSILIMITTFLYLVLFWSTIPEKIPGHYNSSGLIDRWGNKSELWFIFVIGVLMFLGLSVVEHFLKLNIETSKSNQEKVYLLTKGLLINNKFVLTINFTYLIINSLLCLNLPGWYNLVFVGVIFIIIIVYLIRLFLLLK